MPIQVDDMGNILALHLLGTNSELCPDLEFSFRNGQFQCLDLTIDFEHSYLQFWMPDTFEPVLRTAWEHLPLWKTRPQWKAAIIEGTMKKNGLHKTWFLPVSLYIESVKPEEMGIGGVGRRVRLTLSNKRSLASVWEMPKKKG